MEIKLQWNKLENRDFSRLKYLKGVYLFALKRFGGAPYYVGTAGDATSSCLGEKIASHAEMFLECRRAFFLNIEGNSPEDFVFHWARIQNSMEKSNYLFTPGAEVTDDIRRAAKQFFDDLDIYYCALSNEDFEKLEKTPDEALKMIEGKIQAILRDHYKSLQKGGTPLSSPAVTAIPNDVTIRFECADKEFYLSKLEEQGLTK